MTTQTIPAYSTRMRRVESAANQAADRALRLVFEATIAAAQSQQLNGSGVMTFASMARKALLRAAENAIGREASRSMHAGRSLKR